MKYIILCPYGVRTGGPEALFQLSDSLIRNGFDAELWLIMPDEIASINEIVANKGQIFSQAFSLTDRSNVVLEYDKYKFKIFEKYEIGQDFVIVLPEVYSWMLPALLINKVLLWWLSVDNAFASLARFNLNYLRLPSITHAVQSVYAYGFTKSLGLESSYLSDYTVINNLDIVSKCRLKKIAINAGQKVIFNLEKIIEILRQKCPDLKIEMISGLTRDQVYHAFSTSRLFVDLGNFPGKDRMVREAIMLGANVILSNSGAGMNNEDYGIPSLYRLSPYETDKLISLALHVINNPDAHAPMFDNSRGKIMQEKSIFDAQVIDIFATFV